MSKETVIHAEDKFGSHKPMLNGVSVDEAVDELLRAYTITSDSGQDTHGPTDHPVLVRQRKISDNTQGLEGKVKDIIGDSIKADKANAKSIIKELAYALAKIEGYGGKLEDFTDEKSRTYLSQASSALGNPTIGNQTEFIKSIMNLTSAKPGDPAYDANSPLAQLIGYIATQQDDGSRRISYLQQLVQEKWSQPEMGINLQDSIRNKFGIPLNATATASEALGEINRRATLEAQTYAAQAGKTYLKGGGYGAHENRKAA